MQDSSWTCSASPSASAVPCHPEPSEPRGAEWFLSPGRSGQRTTQRGRGGPMTTKADFNAEEWGMITSAPLAATVVAAAERRGTLREGISMARAYQEARQAEHSSFLEELLGSPPAIAAPPADAHKEGGSSGSAGERSARQRQPPGCPCDRADREPRPRASRRRSASWLRPRSRAGAVGRSRIASYHPQSIDTTSSAPSNARSPASRGFSQLLGPTAYRGERI